MSILKSILFGAILMTTIAATPQTKALVNFCKRVFLAQLILEKQPKATEIQQLLLVGFKLDSTNTVGYYINCPDNIQMVAALYKGTQRTVALWFYEKDDAKKEIYEFVEKELNFVYFGSEHLCDYYHNDKFSLRFSPKMDLGLLVYIQLKF